MRSNLLELKTSPELLELVRRAALRPMTREERFEQMVSFVFSMVDEASGITKGDVRNRLERQHHCCISEQWACSVQ